MDRLNQYRDSLENILKNNESTDLADSTAETRVITDRNTDNYQLMRIG